MAGSKLGSGPSRRPWQVIIILSRSESDSEPGLGETLGELAATSAAARARPGSSVGRGYELPMMLVAVPGTRLSNQRVRHWHGLGSGLRLPARCHDGSEPCSAKRLLFEGAAAELSISSAESQLVKYDLFF